MYFRLILINQMHIDVDNKDYITTIFTRTLIMQKQVAGFVQKDQSPCSMYRWESET